MRDMERDLNCVLLLGIFRPEISNSVYFNKIVYEQDTAKGWQTQPAVCNVL